jgi:hypothetical protein
MVTHLHILFVASHNTTTVQSFNSSCTRTLTISVGRLGIGLALLRVGVLSRPQQPQRQRRETEGVTIPCLLRLSVGSSI